MANLGVSQLGLELEYKCFMYESPHSSDSDESMNKNAENLTPLPAPSPEDSLGASAALGRLSVGPFGSIARVQSQRGRQSIAGAHSNVSKRAASLELPRRGKPVPIPQNARNPRQYGSNGVKRPVQQRQQASPKQSFTGPRFRNSRDAVESSIGLTGHTPSKFFQPAGRDSGYETGSSKQNTLQQPHARHLGPPFEQCLPELTEEPKGVVTRLAGPAPVLVDSRFPTLILQPESSPISQDQLAAEVKGIYVSLVVVEAKCINIDAAQAADPKSQLEPEQWQALIALHRTLLYEHHDFLMATQHPSATPALSGLAQKYSIPARIWRHGIHAFLEVLRHRRPKSQDYMLSFIYLAYQMMALLIETVLAFLDTWIECLGDLARYRMAIEEKKEAHSIWGGVAARWYNLASDRHPQIGRLTCVIPFPNTRDSLGTLYNPIVQDQRTTQSGIASSEANTVEYYAHLYCANDYTIRSRLSSEILSQLNNQPSSKLRDMGVSLLVTNIASLFELGSLSNQPWAYFTQSTDASIHASRPSRSAIDDTISSLFNRFTWGELCKFLNTLIQYEPIDRRRREQAQTRTCPGSEDQDDARPRPLSADYLMRGLIWCYWYFPQDFFSCQAKDDIRFFETSAMHKARFERVLWRAMYLTEITGYINHYCCPLRKRCKRLTCSSTSIKKLSNMLKYSILGTCVRLVSSVPGTLAQELVITTTTLEPNPEFKGTPWYSDDPVRHALSYFWRLINPLLLLLPIGFGLVRITKAVQRSKNELKQSVYIRNFGLTTASILGALQQLYDELDHAKLIIVFFWLWFLGEFLTISFRLVRAERQNAFITGITVGTITAAPTLASWVAQTSAGGSCTKQIVKLAIDMTPFIATCCTWGLYEAWRPDQYHRRQILPR